MAEPAFSMHSVTDNATLLLAADVGGTHARLGLVSFAREGATSARPQVVAYRVYPCAAHEGFDHIVRAFCEEHAAQPRRFALACAGYLHEGRVINRHLRWPIEPAALAKALQFDEVRVLNDFEALAHATAYLHDSSLTTVHAPRATNNSLPGPVVVVGPGTGLGVAVRLPGTRSRVLATEAGHIALAARVGREQAVLQALAAADTHVPYDHVLSGPGLLRLYQTLCGMEGIAPTADEPAAVVAAACAGQDARAVEALGLFCAWLGSFVGDLAMLYGATGGIYLAGGFLSRMTGFLAQSAFVERFLDKGVMRPFQQTVPVHVVDHAQLGVIGAASWLHERSTPSAVC